MWKTHHVQTSRGTKDYAVFLALQVSPMQAESTVGVKKSVRNAFRAAGCRPVGEVWKPLT